MAPKRSSNPSSSAPNRHRRRRNAPNTEVAPGNEAPSQVMMLPPTPAVTPAPVVENVSRLAPVVPVETVPAPAPAPAPEENVAPAVVENVPPPPVLPRYVGIAVQTEGPYKEGYGTDPEDFVPETEPRSRNPYDDATDEEYYTDGYSSPDDE